ncbi:extracellular solute-binding protein [Cutibacterium modestum]|uniref:extracellular solute-binding protein n=1 Tax=Cutibacterium modestum TaxID=2559073 RepID=UPI0022871FFA|nr:extracellular solute-binding protein [Cutibacterium modestum]
MVAPVRGSLFAEDGSKTAFDTPEAIETATFIKQLHDEEILPKDTTGLVMDQSFKQFTDGKAAMMIDTEQDAPRIDKAGVKWGYVTSLKKRQQGTMIAADALVMTKRCKVQKTCYDLMTFVESGKQMTKLHKQANFPPIGKDEKNTYAAAFRPIYATQRDILKPLPVVSNSTPAYDALYKNLQQMLNGQKMPEQAMKDAAAEGNKQLGEGK